MVSPFFAPGPCRIYFLDRALTATTSCEVILGVKWISLALPGLGKRRDVVSAFFHVALWCRMVQHFEASISYKKACSFVL